MSINKVILVGYLGDDPKVKEQEDHGPCIGLSVMTAMRDWMDIETGEQQTHEEWHRVLIVDPGLAAFAREHVRKHDRLYIEGQLQTSYWRDSTFEWRSLTQILLARPTDRLTILDQNQSLPGTSSKSKQGVPEPSEIMQQMDQSYA